MYRRMSRKMVSGTNSTLEDRSSKMDIVEVPSVLQPQPSRILINAQVDPQIHGSPKRPFINSGG